MFVDLFLQEVSTLSDFLFSTLLWLISFQSNVKISEHVCMTACFCKCYHPTNSNYFNLHLYCMNLYLLTNQLRAK